MAAQRILLGVIGRPHGTRGLVHVHSYTAVPADLAEYALTDQAGRALTLRWTGEGIAEIAEIVHGQSRSLADRNAAERLTNCRLYGERSALPPPDEDEFYLADLIGLDAVGPEGGSLGRIAAVHDYGAGTSIEITARDRPPLLVPFTRACVPEIDLAGGRVVVAPPAEVVTEREAVG